MAKKTMNVEEIKTWANGILGSKEPYFSKDFKAGVCATIEKILHETNNYQGFMFVDNNDSEIGTMGYFTRTYI